MQNGMEVLNAAAANAGKKKKICNLECELRSKESHFHYYYKFLKKLLFHEIFMYLQ